MLSCNSYKMMPTMAPNHLLITLNGTNMSTSPPTKSHSKPKLGFSIDSIVGDKNNIQNQHLNKLPPTTTPTTIVVDLSPSSPTRSLQSDECCSPIPIRSDSPTNSDNFNSNNLLELKKSSILKNNNNNNNNNNINNNNNKLETKFNRTYLNAINSINLLTNKNFNSSLNSLQSPIECDRLNDVHNKISTATTRTTIEEVLTTQTTTTPSTVTRLNYENSTNFRIDFENDFEKEFRRKFNRNHNKLSPPPLNLIQNGPLSPDDSIKSGNDDCNRSSPPLTLLSPNQQSESNPRSSDIIKESQLLLQSPNSQHSNNNTNNNNNNNNCIENLECKRPILVPGISVTNTNNLIRPFPMQPTANSGSLQLGGGTIPNQDMKTIQSNSYQNGPTTSMLSSHQSLSHLPSSHPPELGGGQNPHHILAAQFQMAAALAHHGQAAAVAAASGNHPGFPPGPPIYHPQFGGPGMIRDSYPLYPWLLSRHGRIFPHRFPGHFLLQPFRKPKRVRTAFSPTQLLKLEHAFEGNHYVVGAERKTLAQSLNLTETQVKVWFQNRRTKHKRMQQEDNSKGGNSGGNGDGSSGRANSPNSPSIDEEDEDDDELIDMEMDDCQSDQEMEQMYHQYNAQYNAMKGEM